ncbi:MAG TPA: VanW family protein [Nocardioides sp.]|nr:VanW family protein [Nocardioides sp.]
MSKKPQRERAGARVVLVMLLVLALMLGVGYLAAYAAAQDKTPRGTEVADVPVGGQTLADAAATLRSGLAPRAEAPITIRIDSAVGGEELTATPADLGLGVDYVASVREAGAGRSWDPVWLWNYYTGGTELDPVVTVSDMTMTDYLTSLAERVGRPARDGRVRFQGTRVRVDQPKPGRSIDPVQAREAITAAYLADDPTAVLDLVAAQPVIDDADVRAAVNDVANPAVSGPVTLVFGDSRVRLQPRDFAAALSFRAEGGALRLHVDRRNLLRLVEQMVAADGGTPVDATVALVDGKPEVVPAKPGITFEPAEVTAAFTAALTRPEGEREATVSAQVEEAAFSTADAKALEIKEQVSTFTTYFPYADYRNTNIGRAMELINGTVLKPGETFSLNDTVGERTPENGFVKGFIIEDGIFKEDYGGGVSQSATTTFNAAFFAGLEDVEHKPHSFYIDRYPVGREATVAWPTVDLKFTNNTPYGVLIQAGITPSSPSAQGVATVTMWSTKYWEITTSESARYNLTEPKTRVLRTEDCYPNTGYGGFDIDVTRHFHLPSDPSQDHDEVMRTTYTPSDTVICRPPRD